ncbi:protein of unknown function [Limnospira indica PCC 8005]|uniref:Uncharacterized protein n=1 Tax=Limnospira indica PCC 8005 TaxID=376219 RepID=A0A9P1KFJ1_9CYAN|nr:protein of unknown function [Limnospira indica PCC 8005]
MRHIPTIFGKHEKITFRDARAPSAPLYVLLFQCLAAVCVVTLDCIGMKRDTLVWYPNIP